MESYTAIQHRKGPRKKVGDDADSRTVGYEPTKRHSRPPISYPHHRKGKASVAGGILVNDGRVLTSNSPQVGPATCVQIRKASTGHGEADTDIGILDDEQKKRYSGLSTPYSRHRTVNASVALYT